MCYSNGPVLTLPGAEFSLTEKEVCERCDKPAIVRVQGETDSFGCEYIFLCRECADKAAQPYIAHCEWCGRKREVTSARDLSEGLGGPVYQVCSPCIRKQEEQFYREIEEYDRTHPPSPYADNDEYDDDEEWLS